MPRLPSPDQLTRSRFSPATGLVSVDLSGQGRALQQAGQSLDKAVDTADHFMDQTAELHARDAWTQLKRKQNELTIGENGYAQLRNGAATEEGVLQKYQELHRQAAERLSAGMNSRARGKFGRMVETAAVDFQAGVLTHIMREDLNHRGEVYKAQVAVMGETMGINYNNPDVIQREMAAIDATVADYVHKNGIKDPSLRERMLQDARGTGHKQVVNGYLEAGDAKAAETYFNVVRQEMTPETAKSVHNMLKPQVANQVGREIAGEMFAMHMEGKSEGEIFERKLQLTDGKSQEVLSVADSIYNNQVKARNADRINQSGDILLSFWNSEQGSGVGDPRLREIDAADPTFGVQIREKMEAISKRRQADAKAAQEGKPDNPGLMALYAEASESIRAGNETPQSITDRYAGVFKDTDFKSLLTLQASTDSAAGKYSIPDVLINAAMPKSANDARRKAAYKGFVEVKLQEWKDANPGKIPTPAEERAIINSAAEEHVEVDRFWFFDSTRAAFETEGRRTYPKRLETMLPNASQDELLSAYSFLQNIRARLTKNDPQVSDADILKLWQERQGK